MSIFSRLKRKVANKRDDDVTAGARLRRIMTAVPRPPQSTNPISGPMRGVTNDGGVIWNETAYESEHLAYSRRIQDQNRSTFVAEAAPGSSNQGNDVSTETALQPVDEVESVGFPSLIANLAIARGVDVGDIDPSTVTADTIHELSASDIIPMKPPRRDLQVDQRAKLVYSLFFPLKEDNLKEVEGMTIDQLLVASGGIKITDVASGSEYDSYLISSNSPSSVRLASARYTLNTVEKVLWFQVLPAIGGIRHLSTIYQQSIVVDSNPDRVDDDRSFTATVRIELAETMLPVFVDAVETVANGLFASVLGTQQFISRLFAHMPILGQEELGSARSKYVKVLDSADSAEELQELFEFKPELARMVSQMDGGVPCSPLNVPLPFPITSETTLKYSELGADGEKLPFGDPLSIQCSILFLPSEGA